MPTFKPRAMPDNLARLRVLEPTIEILKTENEMLNSRLAAAETWAAQAVITKRLDALAPTLSGDRSWLRCVVRLAGGLVCGLTSRRLAHDHSGFDGFGSSNIIMRRSVPASQLSTSKAEQQIN